MGADLGSVLRRVDSTCFASSLCLGFRLNELQTERAGWNSVGIRALDLLSVGSSAGYFQKARKFERQKLSSGAVPDRQAVE